MNKMIYLKQDYNSKTYFLPRFNLKGFVTPDNWVLMTPIRFMGFFLGYTLKLGKANYKFTDNRNNNL